MSSTYVRRRVRGGETRRKVETKGLPCGLSGESLNLGGELVLLCAGSRPSHIMCMVVLVSLHCSSSTLVSQWLF